jgi:hypothetical protein
MSAIDHVSSVVSEETRRLFLRDFDSLKLRTPMDAWDAFLGKLNIEVADCDARNAAQILDRQLLFAFAKDEQTITLSIEVAKMILSHLAKAPMPNGAPPTSLLRKIWQKTSLELAHRLKRELIAAEKTATEAEFDAAEFLSGRYDEWTKETARRRLQDRPENKSKG